MGNLPPRLFCWYNYKMLKHNNLLEFCDSSDPFPLLGQTDQTAEKDQI